MEFFGRVEELKEMKESLSRPGYRGILVYGRRHVGKSRLIAEGLKDFDGLVIYCQCTKGDNQENLDSLFRAYRDASGDELSAQFQSIDDLLKYICARVNGPLAIVLDEYPYWREHSESTPEGMDSLLQKAIDRILAPKGAKFIISGSYLSIMDEIRGDSNPLGGRFKTQISLEPMDYYDASLFYPNYSPIDKVRAYAAFGGLPYILQSIDPSLSVLENIKNLYFSQSGELRKLIPLLIDEEVGKNEALSVVFHSLSSSAKKPTLKDICLRFQDRYSDEWVRKSLLKLEGMKVVRKVIPIESRASDKNTYYQLSDNAFMFYYRFVQPYESAILLGAGNVACDKTAEERETQFVPSIFEEVCRQALIRMNKKGLIDPPIEAIGTYFYNLGARSNGQFDLVSKDGNGYVFYECKFRKLKKSDVDEEIRQVNAMPKFAIHPYKLGFIGTEKGELNGEEGYIVRSIDEFFN